MSKSKHCRYNKFGRTTSYLAGGSAGRECVPPGEDSGPPGELSLLLATVTCLIFRRQEEQNSLSEAQVWPEFHWSSQKCFLLISVSFGSIPVFGNWRDACALEIGVAKNKSSNRTEVLCLCGGSQQRCCWERKWSGRNIKQRFALFFLSNSNIFNYVLLSIPLKIELFFGLLT